MSDSPVRSTRDGDTRLWHEASIDDLLDRAVAAINRGDRATATALAGQVLAVDRDNVEAEDLLAAPNDSGEIRRLTIFFADLVGSTALSTRAEPETYRLVVGRYREQVLHIVQRYEGHIASTKGDGLLAVFGHPVAHEDDVRRAVQAGLEITREVSGLSQQTKRQFGIEIAVRVGIHRGVVYVDTAQDDVYGLAANLAARVSALAPPGAVVVSDAVEALIRNDFELETRPAALVKGVEEPITHYRVVGERTPTPRVGRGPLVGRDRELARLEKCWARARAGTLTIPGVVFRGEPGIGKSRLAAAAAELVEASGGVVLELIGSSSHTDGGLHPVRTLIERRCGIDHSTAPDQRLQLLEAEVAACGLDPITFVPLLAPVLRIGAKAGYEPMEAEGRKLYGLISESVHSYLVACLGAGAALVVAEDVQWFDPSTLEVLGSLLGAAEGRLLVVVTERPGSWLPTSWPISVIDVTPLTDGQTDELITALNSGLSAEDRAAVRDRCGGVPFYIEQVVNGFSENGVPEALYEPLFARLRASAKVVPVVEAAAVIGRQLDRGLLYSVVDLSDDEVDAIINELEDALVLEPWGTNGWRFRHELLRELGTELAPPSVRRALHAKVAGALACDGDPDWRLIAGHYEQAERFNEAASAYQRASEDATRRGALAEARDDLTVAIAQLERAIPGPERDRREMALRLRRGCLPTSTEGYQSRSMAMDFERCLQLGGSDLSYHELSATLTALVVYYLTRADLRRAVQVFESLGARLEQGRQWFGRVIEGSYGVVAWARGEFDAAQSRLERAVTTVSELDKADIDALWYMPNDPIALAHHHLALTRLMRGDLVGAQAELAQAAGWIQQLDFPLGPYSLAYAGFVESWICAEAGQFDRAAAPADSSIDLGQRHGFDGWLLVGYTQRAAVSALTTLATDDLDPAVMATHISTMTALVDTWRSAGLNIYLTFFDSVVARLLIAAGQPEEARARLDTALQLAEDTGMCFYNAELLRLRAHTHTDPDARRADITAAVDLARRQSATLFELRAALDDYEVRGQPGRGALVDVASRIPTNNALPELARAHAALSEVRAESGPATSRGQSRPPNE